MLHVLPCRLHLLPRRLSVPALIRGPVATGGEDSLRAARPEHRPVLSGAELAPYLAVCPALVVMVLFPE